MRAATYRRRQPCCGVAVTSRRACAVAHFRYSESASVHVTPLLSVDSGRDEVCRPQALWQLGEAVASGTTDHTRCHRDTDTDTHAHTYCVLTATHSAITSNVSDAVHRIISYQKFIVRPFTIREPRPQVHYKSQPNAKTPRKKTQKSTNVKSLTKIV